MGVYLTMGGQLAVLGVAVATEPTTEPTFGATFWATVGLIATTLITTIGGFIYQYVREGRNRQWVKEDAAYKEADVAAKAEIARLAEENRKLVAQTATEIKQAITDNTDMNRQALDAANDINAKMRKAQETVAAAAETVAAVVQNVTPPH